MLGYAAQMQLMTCLAMSACSACVPLPDRNMQ